MSSLPRRFEYHLRLPTSQPARAPPPDVTLHRPRPDDGQAMAHLMLDAYRGTIDYDGETLADAQAAVDDYLHGSARPLLDQSWLAQHPQDGFVSACLVAWWPARDRPLIAYVMTQAGWKGRALATTLLAYSLHDLAQAGYNDVRAVITAGNRPSETLFARAGFRRLAAPTTPPADS
ncbi:MAG: GNAT family N-acetyltransferase [Candidatus Promineifilaceae bacterium]|nr:GNAT family N-acetyltransferase [Candidatus Promineifilaceae bacterium]